MSGVDMETSSMPFFSTEMVKLYVLKSVVIEKEKPCVCGACVICTNASKYSDPVHMLKDGKKVEVGGLSELNKKDILMDKPFAGCEAAADKVCEVTEADIEDGEWKETDPMNSQGEGMEALKKESSYMVCTKGWGIIHFVDCGQEVKEFVDELSAFMDLLQAQFGFDNRTVGVLGEVYRAIQEKYADKTAKERGWYFARALSQMAEYNNKRVSIMGISVETHAWRKGAGWVYEYDGEENYFVNELGIAEADYRYMRQMVRLQHMMTSDDENYGYNAVYNMKQAIDSGKKEDEKIIKRFKDWKETLEKATGEKYTDDEYLQRYEELYQSLGNRGDFGHMMYTIAANLIDKGNKVDNKWTNIGAKETSWKNADTRKDIAGWLGDAVYDGTEKKVSFGEDDYIADLDSDNISYNVKDDTELMKIMNQYYEALMAGEEDYRTKTFVENNTYAAIEKAILDRIGVKDKNKDGVKDYKDLEEDDVYKDTYEFLRKLKPYDTAE